MANNKSTSSTFNGDSVVERLNQAMKRKVQIKVKLAHLTKSKQEIEKQGIKIKVGILSSKKEMGRRSKQLLELMKRETELYGQLTEIVGLTRAIPVRANKLRSLSVDPSFVTVMEKKDLRQKERFCPPNCSECVTSCNSECTIKCTTECFICVPACIACPESCTTACPDGTTFSSRKFKRHDKKRGANSIATKVNLRKHSRSQFLINWD
jgi:hypothetical protein